MRWHNIPSSLLLVSRHPKQHLDLSCSPSGSPHTAARLIFPVCVRLLKVNVDARLLLDFW